MWSSSWNAVESAKSSFTSALEKTGDALFSATTTTTTSPATHYDEQESQEITSRRTRPDEEQVTDPTHPPQPQQPSQTTVFSNPNHNHNHNNHNEQSQRQLSFKNLHTGWTSVVQSTKESIHKAQAKLEEEQQKLTERLHNAVLHNTYYANHHNPYQKRNVNLPLDVPALKEAEVVYVTDRLITMNHPAIVNSNSNSAISKERKFAAVGHLLEKRHKGHYMIWNLSEVEYDDNDRYYDNNNVVEESSSSNSSNILECGHVLTYSFPGSPAPPLGLWLKIILSMERWLKADEKNVAIVHCLTGRGRTSTVMAAFLCWMGEAGFSSSSTFMSENSNSNSNNNRNTMLDALEYIAQCKRLSLNELTIPSQRRYASYFHNVLDLIKPAQPPLLLKRVIMSSAPRFAMEPSLTTNDQENDAKDFKRMGCAPYLQIFTGGKLLSTTPASRTSTSSSLSSTSSTTTTTTNTGPPQLVFCRAADGAVHFHVNQMVHGDILLRCRHSMPLSSSTMSSSPQQNKKPQRISLFRAAFHTGYVPPKMMRLTQSQLDGVYTNHTNGNDPEPQPRFPPDFFVDLLFEPVDPATASQSLAMMQQQEPLQEEEQKEGKEKTETGSVYRANGAYDTMLHRDSPFWEVIAARRREQQENMNHHHHHRYHHAAASHHNSKSGEEKEEAPDPTMWGPTVGHRREFFGAATQHRASSANENPNSSNPSSTSSSFNTTFSIGGEFDFLPETIKPPPNPSSKQTPTLDDHDERQQQSSVKKKDTLMEALLGVLTGDDDDADDHDNIDEVIMFTTEGEEEEEDNSKPHASEPGSSLSSSSSAAADTGGVSACPTIVQLPPLRPVANNKTNNNNNNSNKDGDVMADPSSPLLDSGLLPDNDADIDALLAEAAAAVAVESEEATDADGVVPKQEDSFSSSLDLLDNMESLLLEEDLLAVAEVDISDLDDMESFLARNSSGIQK